MDLQFLGTGDMLTMEHRQSNMILTSNDKIMLIDCGTDIRHSLEQVGLTFKDIEAIYISHLHDDHVGGLGGLALKTYFDPTVTYRPILYVSEYIVDDLWETLKGCLQTLQGQKASLETFFDVRPVKGNDHFVWGDGVFTPVQTVHVMNAFTIMPSFGLFIGIEGAKTFTFITTDTQFNPEQIMDFYEQAEIIFQDCETAFKTNVHAHWNDLITLSKEIKEKMWLYHYNDGILPDAIAEGFAGFVKKHQTFNLHKGVLYGTGE